MAPPPGGVGETITLTFPPNMRGAKDAKIEVLENGKDAVDGWTSDPEHPASAMFKDNMNTICFIAKTVMKEQASYTVRVTATVGGKPFAHQWSFKTGNADFGFGPPRPRR
ncbi:MAG: hypothetical protein M5U26_22805 [Planctomycetota bacterium]|nr:hypothetical protein [Planctomycetota bacterium]